MSSSLSFSSFFSAPSLFWRAFTKASMSPWKTFNYCQTELSRESSHLVSSPACLLAQSELPDERPELAGAESHAEHGERLLELRRLNGPGEVGQAGLLPLLARRQELLHLVQELGVLQERLQRLTSQRGGEIHSLATVTSSGSRNLTVIF